MNILLVDIVQVDCETIIAALENNGHEVSTVANPNNVVHFLQTNPRIECVILDQRLGARCGVNLAEEIRDAHITTPVIVMADSEHRLPDGCHLLIKPFHVSETLIPLVETIEIAIPIPV